MRVLNHLKLLNHLLELNRILDLSLRLVLLVLLALRSCRFALHVVGIVAGRKFNDALQSCHFGIALLIVSLEHQHFA